MALVFAFICPPLAAALEAAALGLNALCLVLHTILAATGYSSWLSVGIDVLAIVSDGLGAGAIGGVKATAEVAEGAEEGAAVTAQAGSEAEAEGGTLALSESTKGVDSFDAAEENTDTSATRSELGHQGYQKASGFFGKLSKDDLDGLNPRAMLRDFKSVWKDNISAGQWQAMFKDAQTGDWQVGRTLGGAVKQVFTVRSAEIGEEAGKLDDPETIAQLTRLARTHYRMDISHYTTMWNISKTIDLTTDGIDKLNQVTEFMGGHLPGYSNLEEAMKTGGSSG